MTEIDQTDLLGFLRLRAWNISRERKKKEPRHSTIDVVWPGLKP